MELTREALTEKLAECAIPKYMHNGLIEYVLKGRPVGQFMTAVLSNDLKAACAHADGQNAPLLNMYVFFLYNYCPVGCWGCHENVKTWMEKRGLENVAV